MALSVRGFRFESQSGHVLFPPLIWVHALAVRSEWTLSVLT